VAARFRSKAFAAVAADSRARVQLTRGNAEEAELLFGEATSLWRDMGAPYEEAVTRLGLADACRARGAEQRALLEQRSAQAIIDHIRSVPQIGPDTDPLLHTDPGASPENSFRHQGDYWSIRYEGATVQVRDRMGLHHLARLLAAPGREIHVLDLVALAAGNPGQTSVARPNMRPELGHTGPMLDEQAKAAYRRRLGEIEDDIQDARAGRDLAREQQAEAERDFLLRELAHAVGLGGRDRRANSASERARVSVTRAIRHAMAAIDQHDPNLGRHLRYAIRTGTCCAYLPDTRIAVRWQL
jgi:hypothetical protein